MSWEAATVIGSLGVSFYMIYLKTILDERHEVLKLGLMFISWLSILFTLAHIHFIIQESAAAATENINTAEIFYASFVWVSIGFLAYWFMLLGGRWISSWLEKR